MTELASIDGPLTAFIAGLLTSLHCAIMCGPIAIILTPKIGEEHSFISITGIYHATRITAITIGGFLAGALGMIALGWVQFYQRSVVHFLPWLLVLFFLLLALRLDRLLPHSSTTTKIWSKYSKRLFSLPKPIAAAAIGAGTPFLPCGPLYTIFGLALMTQSPIQGAEFLLAFGLGTLPLLWLAQHQYRIWQTRIPPQRIQSIQRIIALIAAFVIGYRLYLFETTAPNGLFCH